MSRRTDSDSSMEHLDWSPESEVEVQNVESVPEVSAVPEVTADIHSLVAHACMVASRENGVEYGIGQGGERQFSIADILNICYRLDVPASDAEIKKSVASLVRKGVYERGTKRGYFVAGRFIRLTTEDLIAEFREIQARRNPTRR